MGDLQQLTTAFPDSIALASSWDPALAQQYGAVLAGESGSGGDRWDPVPARDRDGLSTLALNDQETDRTTDSSDASERTMQEIDLPAFDAAVKAGVGTVMCSYNRINSVYACQNPYTRAAYGALGLGAGPSEPLSGMPSR